jgi:Cu-processing system ATP-binding protein
MIRVEHLTKRFGKWTAVNDVSFSVREGEVFALLGPNGSGKTTTLKSIAGLVIPNAGSVSVHGLDVQRHPKEARRFMSYLPQRVLFPETLTAREVVAFHCRLRGVPQQRVDDILGRARFTEVADKPVGEFSGGMVQRLGLAVAALPDAPLLLLDEPTASLDPLGVKRFRDFVLHQRENGRTVIFSTHLLAEAEQLADRVGIFVGGKFAAEETVENLKRTYSAVRTMEDMYLYYVGETSHDSA